MLNPYYKDDDITIYHGDCLEIMPQLPEKFIDFILCDLPYGTTACKWDVIIPFDKLWENYKRLIKEDGVIALFGNEPFSSQLRISNLKWYKYDWIWDKVNISNPFLAKKQPLRCYENISIFYNKKCKYFPQMISRPNPKFSKEYCRSELYGGNAIIRSDYSAMYDSWYPKNILRFSNFDRTNKFHPTQKPVELCSYLIKTYTNEGDLVLDNCMGSGSTLIAAKQCNRKAIGIEIDETYCKIAVNRLKYGDAYNKRPKRIMNENGLFSEEDDV